MVSRSCISLLIVSRSLLKPSHTLSHIFSHSLTHSLTRGPGLKGEFELGLDGVDLGGIDLDMSTFDLSVGDNFDVSGLLDGIFH